MCSQSLAGHTSPVESVQFNPLEESVVAGSQSGTMKIWDVEAAKSKYDRDINCREELVELHHGNKLMYSFLYYRILINSSLLAIANANSPF